MFNKTDPKNRIGEAQTIGTASNPASLNLKEEPAFIGPSIHISGHIRGNEDLTVHGHVEGSIHLGDGLLIVAREGQVDADVSARVINVQGRIDGDLKATEQILVRRSGEVRGSVTAPGIALDFGCTINGAVDTQAAEESAPAAGDDKIADFKLASSSTGGGATKSTTGKGSAG